MAKKNKSVGPDEISDLRRRAEEMLLKQPGAQDKIRPADVQRLVHELQVHQIELEMQNQELRRIQQELEASREKYFDLYDLAPVGYVTLNEKAMILEANFTAAVLLGTERRHLVRHPLSRFIVREDQDIFYRHRKQLVETREHQECDVMIMKGDGSRIWARLESVASKEDDGKPAFRTAIIDITKRKEMEAELVRHKEHLEDIVKERTSELRSANEELEAFNYTVSHDLRAPLRHMRGFLELLQKRMEGCMDAKSREYALLISKSSMKMERLIKDLLTFASLGREKMQMREVNLDHILRESVQEFSAETRVRDIEWKLDKLPSVYGVPSMLKLVLDSLISNAVKFTRTCPHAAIEIGCKADEKEDVFFVKDNGAGFDMKYSDRLFGVFQRLHTQDEFEGTGIGLANVRRIISMHGGRTWARGAEGQGATIFFSLPRPKEPGR